MRQSCAVMNIFQVSDLNMHIFFRNILKNASLALKYHFATTYNIYAHYFFLHLSKGWNRRTRHNTFKRMELINSTWLDFSKLVVPLTKSMYPTLSETTNSPERITFRQIFSS